MRAAVWRSAGRAARRAGAEAPRYARAMSATAARPKLRPLDPLDLDGLLSDEDRLIAETVRRFAADRVLPHVDDRTEQGTLPTRDLAPAIGELGLLGRAVGGYGCAGASATTFHVACRELEAADSVPGSFGRVQV